MGYSQQQHKSEFYSKHKSELYSAGGSPFISMIEISNIKCNDNDTYNATFKKSLVDFLNKFKRHCIGLNISNIRFNIIVNCPDCRHKIVLTQFCDCNR